MTTLTYYCTIEDVRRQMGVSDANVISDADITQLIILAQEEVDTLTHTTFLPVQSTGTATSGDATTINNTGATWTIDEWNTDPDLISNGYAAWIYSGTNNGQVRTIIDGTATSLTVSPAFTNAIDNTSKYRIIKNTYVDETFTGDGEDTYFTNKYPILSLYSLTIDGTSITATSLYKVDAWGKLQLSSASEASYFADSYPLLNNTKYYYGVFPVPILVKDLTSVIAGIMAAVKMMGQTYTFATGYSIPDMSIQKGVPYPHFEHVTRSLVTKRDFLISQLMNKLVRPMFG